MTAKTRDKTDRKLSPEKNVVFGNVNCVHQGSNKLKENMTT